MNGIDRAIELHSQGFNCAQAVFGAYCENFGVDVEQALKLSCAFGGGLAQYRGRCGAVTGACMLIGLKYGMSAPGDTASKLKTYKIVREFVERFEERNATSICSELIRMKPLEADPAAFARAKPICEKVIRDAAQIVGEMLGL